MRMLLLGTALAVAAVIELVLLRRFAFHPMFGGTPDENLNYLFQLATWAALPFLWSALLIVAAAIRRRALTLPVAPLMVVAFMGPVHAYMALNEGGHSGPVVLFLGFVIQCIALLIASIQVVRRLIKPSTQHP